jgi:hypothetical protein
MTIKIVTYWATLLQKARRLAKARQGTDQKEIDDAYNDLRAYEDLVKVSDELVLPRRD